MTHTLVQSDYPAFLAELKQRILYARTSAIRAISHELFLLYWDIGRGIIQKQQNAGWGDAVDAKLIRPANPDSESRKHASYVPFWS